MRTDSETGVAGGDPCLVYTPLCGRNGAPEPKHGDAKRGQLGGKTIAVLMGQNLGGGEEGHLFSGFQSVKGSQGGDERLAAADIALEDADHGLCPPQIVADLLKCPPLPLGGAPRQPCQVAVDEMAGANERRGRPVVEAAAPKTCPEDVGGQLLCGKSSSGLFQNVLDVVFGGWSVEDAERFGQGGDIEPRAVKKRCERIGPGRVVREVRESVPNETRPSPRRYRPPCGIDRLEALWSGSPRCGRATASGVDHLEPVRTLTQSPVSGDSLAWREPAAEPWENMQKAQGQDFPTGPVGQDGDEGSARSRCLEDPHDRPFDKPDGTGLSGGVRERGGPVLIAQRELEENVGTGG